MFLKSELAAELPYLRRYARALYGSRRTAEDSILFALELISLNKNFLSGPGTARVAMFRAFIRTLCHMNTAFLDDLYDPQAGARLTRPMPGAPTAAAAAYLLIYLEHFTIAQGANILEAREEQFDRLLSYAVKRIGALRATDVLLVEGDIGIALQLEGLLRRDNHKIAGIARSGVEAEKIVWSMAQHGRRPGLIVSDGQLSFEKAHQSAAINIASHGLIPTVYVSGQHRAHPSHDHDDAAFVIDNPFNPDLVSAVIGQALFVSNGSYAH